MQRIQYNPYSNKIKESEIHYILYISKATVAVASFRNTKYETVVSYKLLLSDDNIIEIVII
jgi:hypothetical protein